tara:strand:- start:9719 stop:10129 length:411 start_codon:yes stop_codon:yes gene_type:complete
MTDKIKATIITDTLEKIVERVGDPTELVYKRLFALHPELEPMFVMDKNGAARGHMLSEALDGIVDFVGERNYSDNLIRSEIVNHANLGVPPEIFATFYNVVAATFKDALGEDWTDEMETAWSGVLDELTATVEERV